MFYMSFSHQLVIGFLLVQRIAVSYCEDHLSFLFKQGE
jgi:hypothetical protein